MKKMVLLVLVGILCQVCLGTRALYVVTEDGHILGFEGMVRGMENALGGIGDTSFADVFIDGQSFTCVTAGNEGGIYGSEVIVGTKMSMLYAYTSDLNALFAVADSDGPGANAPITALTCGSFGPWPRTVIACNSWYNNPADQGATVLAFTYDLLYMHHRSINAAGLRMMGVKLGDLDTTLPGNELITGSYDPNVPVDRSSGRISTHYWKTGAGIREIWILGTMGINNTVTDVQLWDLYPALGRGAEIVAVGCSPASYTSGPGDGSQALLYTTQGQLPTTGEVPWVHNLNRDPEGKTVVASVIADVFGDSGPELIEVGETQLWIVDADPPFTPGEDPNLAPTLQMIETNQPCTSVVVEDVLEDDGVREIIVGCRSGIILVFEHQDPADLNSPFVIDENHGTIFRLDHEVDGTSYQITGLAAGTLDLPMDFNFDHTVDLEDFAVFAQSWLVAEPHLRMDFDRNGNVNVSDLQRFIEYWLTYE